MAQILSSGSGGVKVHLRAPSVGIDMERYLSAGVPLYQLKGTLEQITGIPPTGQTLRLLRTPAAGAGGASVPLADEGLTLFDYGVQTGSVVVVEGAAPAWLAAARATDVGDDESVPKYEMSQADYEARSNTVRAQLAAVRARQAQQMQQSGGDDGGGGGGGGGVARPEAPPEAGAEAQRSIKVGDRCEVDRATGTARGTVRFVGEAEMPAPASRPGATRSAAGIWVGVQYDEPVGANDGSIAGKRYFAALPKYGGFVRPDKVRIGEFPEEDLFDEEEDEEI